MDERECRNQAARIEELIQEVTAFPDQHVRSRIEELLHALLGMYGAGLTRMVAMVAETELTGKVLLQQFAGDELVGSLLLLHGLHPVGLEERIRQAIEKLRPSAQTQGGTLELIRVEDGAAVLQLAGARRGCGASTQALKQTIESAIYDAAPELDEVRVEEVAAPQRVGIPVRFVSPRKQKEQTSASEQTDAQPQGRADVSGTR